MAIEYERVNWDTTKFVNPSNMNQMDLGIKNACDGVDALEVSTGEIEEEITAINTNLGQKSEASAVSGDTAFAKINSVYNSLTQNDKIELTLNANNFSKNGGCYVKKMPNGTYFINIVATATANTGFGTVVATLPVGYRPTELHVIPCVCTQETSLNAFVGGVNVNPNGNIQLFAPTMTSGRHLTINGFFS